MLTHYTDAEIKQKLKELVVIADSREQGNPPSYTLSPDTMARIVSRFTSILFHGWTSTTFSTRAVRWKPETIPSCWATPPSKTRLW